jgi:hypothetical protein
MTNLEHYLSMVKAYEKAAHLLLEGRKAEARKWIERDTPWHIYELGVEWAANSKKDGFDAACCRYVLSTFDPPYYGKHNPVEGFRMQYLKLSNPKPNIVIIYWDRYQIDWQKWEGKLVASRTSEYASQS